MELANSCVSHSLNLRSTFRIMLNSKVTGCSNVMMCLSTKLHCVTSEKTVDVEPNDVYTAKENGANLRAHY